MRLEVNSMNEWKDVVCSVFQLKIIIGRKHCDGRKSNWTFESDRSCRLWEIESVRFNRSSLERDSKHQQELVLLGRRCDRCAHQQRTTPSLPSIGLDLLVPKLFGRRFHFFFDELKHTLFLLLFNKFFFETNDSSWLFNWISFFSMPKDQDGNWISCSSCQKKSSKKWRKFEQHGYLCNPCYVRIRKKKKRRKEKITSRDYCGGISSINPRNPSNFSNSEESHTIGLFWNPTCGRCPHPWDLSKYCREIFQGFARERSFERDKISDGCFETKKTRIRRIPRCCQRNSPNHQWEKVPIKKRDLEKNVWEVLSSNWRKKSLTFVEDQLHEDHEEGTYP